MMEQQAKDYGIPMTRIVGVDGVKYNIHQGTVSLTDAPRNKAHSYTYQSDYLEKMYTPNDDPVYVSRPEFGCTLSHIKAIYNAYISGKEYCLILEDDVSLELIPFCKLTLPELMQNAPSNWTVIALHPLFNECKKNAVETYLPFEKSKCYGASTYVICRQGMSNLLDKVFYPKHHWLEHKKDIVLAHRGDASSRSKANRAVSLRFDPKNDMVSSQKEALSFIADIFIYTKAGPGAYWYTGPPMFFVKNDTAAMDSTIHPSDTVDHIRYSVENIRYHIMENGRQRESWVMSGSIPHIIHWVWNYTDNRPIPERLQRMIDRCKHMHPTWTVMLWDEQKSMDLLTKHFSWFIPTYMAYDVHIKRVDAIRYFILYHYGGVYIDTDTICVRRLDLVTEKNQKPVFGKQYRDDDHPDLLANGVMFAPKQSFVMEFLFAGLVNAAKQGVIQATGPEYLTQRLHEFDTMFGSGHYTALPFGVMYTHQWDDEQGNELAICEQSAEQCGKIYPTTVATTPFMGSWNITADTDTSIDLDQNTNQN